MAEVVLELDADLLEDLASTGRDRGFENKGAYIRWVLEQHAALEPPPEDPGADLGQSASPSLEPDTGGEPDIPEGTAGADDDEVAQALEEIEDELDEE